MTLPRITNDEDWIDLRIGAEATVRARLDSVSAGTLLLTFPSWDQLVIETFAGRPLTPFVGQDIEIVVTRVEDGLGATTEAVTAAVEKAFGTLAPCV